MRRPLSTLALVLTVPFATGCSFVFVKEPLGELAAPRGCTLSYAAPIVDAVLAAGALAGAAYLMADDSNNDPSLPVGATLAFAWSAGDGFGAVGRCRNLMLASTSVRPDLYESKENSPGGRPRDRSGVPR